MKHAIAIVLLGTTLIAGSALLAAGPGGAVLMRAAEAGLAADPVTDGALILADGDEDGEGDDEDGDGGWFWSSEGDDEDEDCDAEEEGEEQDEGCVPEKSAAPAGPASPPRNGLFTDGTAPSVKSN